MIKDGLNAEQVAETQRLAREAQANHHRGVERAAWAELFHTYERCVEIAERVWKARIEDASAQQHALAAQMRDRPTSNHVDAAMGRITDAGIPVPLFTPRDRQQFVKEVAATLLIGADRRNLTVLYPREPETPE